MSRRMPSGPDDQGRADLGTIGANMVVVLNWLEELKSAFALATSAYVDGLKTLRAA